MKIGYAMAMLLVSCAAQASDLSVKLEPSELQILSAPQNRLFSLGGGFWAKAMLGIGRYTDLTVSAGVIGLLAATHPDSSEIGPIDPSFSRPGTAWSFGPGLRVRFPYDELCLFGATPWVDADSLFVRTGFLNRMGFAVAAGAGFPLDDARRFWVGPFVRYFQLFQNNSRVGYDNSDLMILLVGLSFEHQIHAVHTVTKGRNQ